MLDQCVGVEWKGEGVVCVVITFFDRLSINRILWPVVNPSCGQLNRKNGFSQVPVQTNSSYGTGNFKFQILENGYILKFRATVGMCIENPTLWGSGS